MKKLFIFLNMLFLLSNLLFAGRYYDAAVGRYLQIDPLATKYPSMSPYNYTLNNPLKYIDPDGKDVLNAITLDPLSVSEMTERAKNLISQMNSTKQGAFTLNVLTTHSNFRKDLYQRLGGRQVDWGGSMDVNVLGGQTTYARFSLNTMFTLNPYQLANNWQTQMTASVDVSINDALSQEYGSNILNVKFGGTIFDENGNSVRSDNILIITGTISEVNEALAGTGYEVQLNDQGKYNFIKIEDDEDDDENNE